MNLGYDERCAADLSNVVEGRALSQDDAAWLTRVVTGAVRPNRDKPFWDLAHALRALAAGPADDGAALCDLILDPQLARNEALSRRLAQVALDPHARLDERGLVLGGLERDWHASWKGVARLLALAEFLLTAEDLAHFAELRRWLAELGAAGEARSAIDLLVKRLVRLAAGYRQEHLPLAPVERRFRMILNHLAARPGPSRHDQFGDDDILDLWRAENADGERPQFRTIAEHFVTYQAVLAALGGLAGLRQAASLETIVDWADRLDASLNEAVGLDEISVKLAAALAAIPDVPKILTGAERQDLIDIIWLEPFHRTRPLTVLRSISFGRVQSGIANRLRRGSGGGDVAERVRCDDAETYDAIVARADALAKHLERMTRIAAALRIGPAGRGDPKVAAVLAAAEADLARVRRAGFDAGREALEAAYAAVDETLARAMAEIPLFVKASSPAQDRFEADRIVFAAAFHEAYLGKQQDHERARPVAG